MYGMLQELGQRPKPISRRSPYLRKLVGFLFKLKKMNRTVISEFCDCNILSATIQHNGFCGGDAVHGGFVKLTLKDESSTCMFCNGKETDFIEIIFRGDSERKTLLDALKMFVKELEENF